MKQVFLFFISLVIVSWGHPPKHPILCVGAASVGFALFWIFLAAIQGKKRRFCYSSFWFFGVQLVQLSWLASPTYQGAYIYFVYLLVSLWLGLQFGVISLCLPSQNPIPLKRILGIASLWTLLEWGRLFVLCGFAWNPVGLALTGTTAGGQLASILGIFGLSFFVLFTNLLALNFFFTKTGKSAAAWLLTALFPYCFGALSIYFHDSQQRGEEFFHALLVQTALLPDEKDPYSGKEGRYIHPLLQWAHILGYIEEHRSRNVDLIVLPEYALPFTSHAPVYPCSHLKKIWKSGWKEVETLLSSPLAEKKGGEWFVSNALLMQALANHYRAEVVVGLDAKEGEEHYNAAFHFIPNSQKLFRYEKRVLLPLAEYLPFSALKPLVERYGIVGSFSRGQEAKVTEGKCLMSLSICYEECFPHIMRAGRTKGASLFVTITNDGWYPYSQLPEKHLIHGRVRAIENGIPLLRACNTGVTAGVDHLGRVVARFENSRGEFELIRGALYVSIPLISSPTLYTLWGDGCILTLSALFLLSCFWVRENLLAEKHSLA